MPLVYLFIYFLRPTRFESIKKSFWRRTRIRHRRSNGKSGNGDGCICLYILPICLSAYTFEISQMNFFSPFRFSYIITLLFYIPNLIMMTATLFCFQGPTWWRRRLSPLEGKWIRNASCENKMTIELRIYKLLIFSKCFYFHLVSMWPSLTYSCSFKRS